ncbi:hypothetical protein HJC23_004044 [Cyclotella cryptica]|uniref:Uncharacterized protein n=1 Tax=Cyclotella cryptica TaxID=29204 RepID=A0ABD3QUF4_9STRA|eukprot:CCRYP_002032-RA/>CCRYP_002032-RA protein AED:0.15 eAED:0.15 QI:0/-1/0/1/-1/1/1/0/547
MVSTYLSLAAVAVGPLLVVSQNIVALSNGQDALLHLLETHPDVIDDYFPDKEAKEEYERYRVSYPPIEDYVISILVNPCGQNGTHGREDDIALGYDCCISRFGAGEYGYRQGSRNLFSNGYSNGIPMSVDEPLHNIDLVDEFGNILDYRYSRRADDIVYIDESCRGLREPHSACIADRFAASVNNVKPPCWDYNETVDATLDCFTTSGKRQRNCMQTSYSQNAYIHVCGGKFANDNTCGTFLEIHKANGTPYDDEGTILSDVRLTTHSTEGMQTTTLPLTYKGDPNRILCSYEEMNLQVGSMVQIKGNTASCCCPRLLSPNRSSKIGAFFCPKRKSSKDGPFAPKVESLDEIFLDDVFQRTSFPFCPAFDDAKDVLMCTHERIFADDIPLDRPERYFSMPCASLEKQGDHDNKYTSDNLSGVYTNVCPLGGAFSACGLSSSSLGECQGTDFHFTFKDEIGKVVQLPKSASGKYGVTFNDGRSVYWFARSELEFLKPPGNYEVWFVKRNRFEKIVEKKKPFRVVWPRCTYDSANGRYFPWFSTNSTQT